MKTLNIKGDGTVICHWGVNEIITNTANPDIPEDIKDQMDNLMAEIQADGFQEIHFEYGMGRNFTHKSGVNKLIEIPNTENSLFETMETWATSLIEEASNEPPEGSGD